MQAFSQGESLLSLVKDNPDVVLAKGAAPAADFSIIFQPTGESVWWTKLGDEVTAGAARVLVEDHPALRHLDAASIPFVGARQITPAAGAQVLVADDNGLPLIYKARHGRQTAIVVNLDPVAAEFYFSAWFPVLVHSAVTHLAGHENRARRRLSTRRAGHDSGRSRRRDDESHRAARADEQRRVEPRRCNRRRIPRCDQLGFYTLENPSGTHTVGASLLSSAETLLNNESSQSNNEPLSRGHSPAGWLTLLAIVALTAESVLYHRRKVG